MDADAMQALLVTTENRLQRAWIAMIDHLRDLNTVEEIESRRYMDPSWVLDGVDDAAARFAAGEHAAYIHAGQVTARWLHGQLVPPRPRRTRVAKKLTVFDAVDPPAVRWAQANRLELIREITQETREMIHAAMVDAARSGVNPREWAREIRDSIGLTEYQRGLVENYRRELTSGQHAAALERELSSGHSDRAIANAIRNEVQLTQQQIETAVERYRANWQAYRAENIARTEGLRVAHQGSEELYRQAVESGDLEASQIERTWNHSPRRSTAARRGRDAGRGGKSGPRSFHVSMHGDTVGFGEKFISGIGGELRYPGDPEAGPEETLNCACAVSTRIRPGAGAAGAQGGMPQGEMAAEAGDLEAADEAALEEDAAAVAEETAIEDEFATDPEPESVDPAEIADEMTANLQAGDLEAAGRQLDDLFDRIGLQRQELIGPEPVQRVVVSDDGMVMQDHSGKTIMATAYRNWNGEIRVSTTLGRHLRSAGVVDVEAAGARMRALDAQIEDLKAKHPPRGRSKKVTAQFDALYADRDVAMHEYINARMSADAPREFVHETLHGFSPISPHAYRGAAGQVEELTTEVVARFATRNIFGTNLVPHRYGGYSREISAAVDAVWDLTGKTAESAFEAVYRASVRFKQRTGRLTSVDAVVRAFADDLAETTGADRELMGEALRRNLADATVAP